MCHSTIIIARPRQRPVSALLSYIMPVFRQSGCAFALGVSVCPKWLLSWELWRFLARRRQQQLQPWVSTYCAFRPSPASSANKQQSKRRKLIFLPPSLLQQNLCMMHLALCQLYISIARLWHWRGQTWLLVQEQVGGCCIFFVFVLFIFCHPESGS